MSCRDQDAADLPEASYWPDIYGEIDGDLDEHNFRSQLEAQIGRRAAQVANHVIATILGSRNPSLELYAYAIAHGLGGLGEHSISYYARQFRVTKQAISKEITRFRDVYRLEAMGGLKKTESRLVYKKVQLERKKNSHERSISNRADLYGKSCCT